MYLVAAYFSQLRVAMIALFSVQTAGFLTSSFVERKTGVLGQDRWWFSSVHAAFYLVATVSAGLNWPGTWVVLLSDIIFSVLTWYFYHVAQKL